MADSEKSRIDAALNADKEEMGQFVHDPSSSVLLSLLRNPNLDEKDVLIIASRNNVQPEVLVTIAKDKRWNESYLVRLALAKNPRSPLTVSLSLARFLRIFDLEEITRNHGVPIVLRKKVEAMIIERVPTMPLGNKKTLAKKAAGPVLLKLLQDRIPEVAKLCLDNPHMIEVHLFKVISRPDTIAQTIMMIARHPVWSNRPSIRLSLVRNSHTSLALTQTFLSSMKLIDLRDLYADPSLLATIKPFVYRELLNRGADPEKHEDDRIYEISEEELNELKKESESGEMEAPDDQEEDSDEDNAAG